MKSLIETDVGEKRWPCHFCSEGCTSQMRHHTFLWDNCIPICLSPFLCESVKQHTEDAVPFSLHSLNGQFVREAWHQRARRSNFFNKGWCDTLWQPVIPQFSSSKCGGGLSHTLTSTHHPVQFPVVNRAAVYSLSFFFSLPENDCCVSETFAPFTVCCCHRHSVHRTGVGELFDLQDTMGPKIGQGQRADRWCVRVN